MTFQRVWLFVTIAFLLLFIGNQAYATPQLYFDQSAYQPGDSFTITIVDASQNKNSNAIDQVELGVEFDINPDQIIWGTIDETGPDTGIFELHEIMPPNDERFDVIIKAWYTFDAGGGVTQSIYDSVILLSSRQGTTASIQTDKSSYIIGTDMVITFNDPDSDINSTVDQINPSRFEIIYKGGTTNLSDPVFDPSPKWFTETGDRTGLFQIVVKIPQKIGTTTLQDGDVLTIRYYDDFTSDGIPKFVSAKVNVIEISITPSPSRITATLQTDRSSYDIGTDAIITLTYPPLDITSNVDKINAKQIQVYYKGEQTTIADSVFDASSSYITETGGSTGLFQIVINIPQKIGSTTLQDGDHISLWFVDNGINITNVIFGVNVASDKDTDGDGINDDVDVCPSQPETVNGYLDSDGCPDTLPTKDTDGDGINDDVDVCPSQPETVNGYLDSDGCPDTLPTQTDIDNDGIKDPQDKCPYEKETYNGFEDTDGCPDLPPMDDPPKTHEVSIPLGSRERGCEDTNSCYSPYSIIVNLGDTITWNNNDNGPHTTTSGNPHQGKDGKFDTGILQAGEKYSHTFDSVGTLDYYCKIHPWQAGKIIVTTVSTTQKSSMTPVSPDVSIPNWVKGIAGFWCDGGITNSDFIEALEFLIEQEIINVPSTKSGTGSASQNVPEWVKNTACWWSEGAITDAEFANSVQFLIKEGVIQI